MAITLKVYDNGDHTCLVWLPSDAKPIPNCRGFAVRRVLDGGAPDYLHGFVGFSDADRPDPAKPWMFPVQRFLWWDYDVKPGSTVQYSVIPVVGPDKDHLALDETKASQLTEKLTVSSQCTQHLAAYFNKGIVAAQWVSRALADEPKGKNIADLVKTSGDKLRNELSGLLRLQLLELLDGVKRDGGRIFAALYELNDPELIDRLVALGKDANVILANGAFKPPSNDENAGVRGALRGKITLYDRIVKTPHFGHNKFVVFCDAAGKPQRVLTGSTNWTSSGLSTQANNGLVIDDPAVAQDFLDAWNRIRAAGNDYPPSLVTANSTAQTFQVDGCKVTPWFVPTKAAQDLEYARRLINAAKQGILFLFFNPGTFQPETAPQRWTLLQNILYRHHQGNNPLYDPNLYLKGVVNQQIPYLTEGAGKPKKAPVGSMDPSASGQPIALYTNGIEPPQQLGHDVMVPANIKTGFHEWEKELLGASMVDIHSKVIVIDPFGENPVVMTGSHNLGFKASSENDDNLVIIEGNAPLAVAYALNIIAIFQGYRWNSYAEAHRQDPKVWHGLEDSDTWQAGHLQGDPLAELKFWLGDGEEEAVQPAMGTTAVAPAATPPRRALARPHSVSTRGSSPHAHGH
jgi:phosphatidylserine/phosphatidylglycerophosphate/cardiolipin synthase-like enzyme